MAFKDPTAPIATCSKPDCTDCRVTDSIHCHFRPIELVHFLLISTPSFLVGGAALYAAGWLPLILWIGVVFGYFGFVEIRVMCSHCPHYADEGSTLGCWANHGSLKLWKYRPGPMSTAEKVVFLGGFAVVWGAPVPSFLAGGLWFLFGLYVLLVAGFFMTLKMFLCTQCMNFACPLNGVPDEARALFFECNPVVAEAWNCKRDG